VTALLNAGHMGSVLVIEHDMTNTDSLIKRYFIKLTKGVSDVLINTLRLLFVLRWFNPATYVVFKTTV